LVGQVGLGVSKRAFFPKEKVCLVAERLVGEWLMVWKGATDLMQNLSFIKIIMPKMIKSKGNFNALLS